MTSIRCVHSVNWTDCLELKLRGISHCLTNCWNLPLNNSVKHFLIGMMRCIASASSFQLKFSTWKVERNLGMIVLVFRCIRLAIGRFSNHFVLQSLYQRVCNYNCCFHWKLFSSILCCSGKNFILHPFQTTGENRLQLAPVTGASYGKNLTWQFVANY